MPTPRQIAFIALATIVGSVACNGEEPARHHRKKIEAETAATATAAPVPAAAAGVGEESVKLFKSRCAVCHGESGTGNGPGAAALTPKPRDYTNAEWQAKVTDDQIRSVILMGGA